MEEEQPTVESSKEEIERNRTWWKVGKILDNLINILIKDR